MTPQTLMKSSIVTHLTTGKRHSETKRRGKNVAHNFDHVSARWMTHLSLLQYRRQVSTGSLFLASNINDWAILCLKITIFFIEKTSIYLFIYLYLCKDYFRWWYYSHVFDWTSAFSTALLTTMANRDISVSKTNIATQCQRNRIDKTSILER